MDSPRTNFEQVPIEVARRAAAQEGARTKGADWVSLAEQVLREEDSAKLIGLVTRLNNALDKREGKK